MRIEAIQELKAEAEAAGVPIQYVSEPGDGQVRIVFADSYVASSATVARNHIKIEQAQRGV